MSDLENPIAVLIDSTGTPIGTPTNVLYVSGSLSVAPSRSSSAATFAVSASVFSSPVLSANPARLGAIFVNDAPAPAVAYLLFGSGSRLDSWTYRVSPGGTVELNSPVYTGVVSAVWNVATGSLRVTELT